MEEGEEEELQRTALLRKRQEALRREKITVVGRWEYQPCGLVMERVFLVIKRMRNQ